jgi:RNA-directed DNA polymerase
MTIKRKIKQWLKAGVIDNGVFDNTEAGTPQGGVISPLLANIALDGMVRHIENMFPKKGSRVQATVVRYADDFVVISPKLEIIEQCKIAISEWLKPAGLQLKPEKTRICHTLQEIEVDGVKVPPGFDFLGFNIRQYPKGKHTSGKSGGPSQSSKRLGFKTNIKPSKKAIKAHTEKVKEVINKHKTSPQAALIKELNPIITGWARYYSGTVSSEILNKLDNILWQQLRAWVVSRCGNAKYKTLRKYFQFGKVILSNGKERKEKWIFQAKDGLRLQKHNWTPIVYHKLVRPDASTYDGNWVYWATRRGKSPEISNREAQLLKNQKGKCKWCGQHFTIEDQVEIDHIIPRSLGGKDDYKNLQLLHRHCHDAKTAIDGSRSKGRTHDNETTELGAV